MCFDIKSQFASVSVLWLFTFMLMFSITWNGEETAPEGQTVSNVVDKDVRVGVSNPWAAFGLTLLSALVMSSDVSFAVTNAESGMDTGHSTWCTWWCLFHNLLAGLTYVQPKTGNSIHHTFALPLNRDRFLSQLYRHWITCRLTFKCLSTISTSKRHLKTYLFMIAYCC